MARIIGVDIPRNKVMRVALRTLYGVGPSNAVDILVAANIQPDKNSNDLTEEDIQKIRVELDKYTL